MATVLSFCAPVCLLSELTVLARNPDDWVKAQHDLLRMAVHSTSTAIVATRVESTEKPTGGSQQLFDLAVKREEAARLLLHHAIHAEAEHIRPELSSSYLAWTDRLTPLPVSEMPTELFLELHDYSDPSLHSLAFPVPCPPPTTLWLPRAVQPAPPLDFRPQLLGDLLTEWAIRRINKWMTTQLEFLIEIEQVGAAAIRRSNEPLALGQDAFKPQARGIVWDLRRMAEGIIVPVDFDEPVSSHLDLNYLAEALADWPDQELLSFLLDGVRYKADVDFQIVLLPHLVSLREGYVSLQNEVDKYEQAGWYGVFSHPPFLPFRAVPKGSVPRKLEPTRPRPTTKAGAPRQLLLDTDQKRVLSLNEASSGSVNQAVADIGIQAELTAPKWPKENKPTVADALTCIALLTSVGTMLSLPLYTAADDFRNFFNQLKLAPEEFWKCGMVLAKEGQAKFVSEYIMTFGLRPASNIAQRFADAILDIWRRNMQETDTQHLKRHMQQSPQFAAWVESRGGPSSAASQLFASFIYTDDPIFIVLGADRMARALRIWTDTCDRIGLLMAIPAKRQCGTHVHWLGACLSTTLAVAWVPPHKIVSALSKLDMAISGSITVAEYHSLLGLLEHLVFLNRMQRCIMYSLWTPFQSKVALEPNRLIVVTPAMMKSLQKWHRLLTMHAGIAAIRVISSKPPLPSTIALTSYSDAMRELPQAGLGGWFHGYYWSASLHPCYACIPIAALEFIAALTSILTFADLLSTSNCMSHTLHARVDALSTPYILTEHAASSPATIALHSFVMDLPLFRCISENLFISHVAGVGNELADSASRGHLDRIDRLAAQLKLSANRIQPHPIMIELLDVALPFYG